MSNYIKHLGSHTLQQLKRLSFDELKALFETTMRRVKFFHPIESEGDKTVLELTTGSAKRDAEVELDHEGSKKQKTNEASGTIKPTDHKEKELWVELKRLFEPDSDDTLWKLQRYMHDPLVWRLYDTCGVHHVSSVRGHNIFMLAEKDYPFSKGVQMLMLANKLWFNSEKLVDSDDNHKFRGGLLGFKPITLSTAKRRVYTAMLSYYCQG
ncbi:hypothetical protein Tco_0880972 [Tanacetum coccineum]